MPAEARAGLVGRPRAKQEGARRLDRAAGWMVLGIAPGMLHAYALAEALIALIGLGFLARSALLGDWAWLRRGWVRLGLAWWGWAVICSQRRFA